MKMGTLISLIIFPVVLAGTVANAAQGWDDHRLRKNLAERMISLAKGENQRFDISADKIQVLQVELVTVGGITLSPVKFTRYNTI